MKDKPFKKGNYNKDEPKKTQVESLDDTIHAPKGDDKEQAQESVIESNPYVQDVRRKLSFKLKEHNCPPTIQVLDADTNVVIRELPYNEFVRLSYKLNEVRGLFIKTKT